MDLLKKGDPRLRMVAQPVEIESDVTELVKYMKQALLDHSGIGIAANQVGDLIRIIIVVIDGVPSCIINPVFAKKSSATFNSYEACLSVPGVNVKVKRSSNVVVTGFDENWKPVKYSLTGLEASCVQHEIDHLNGKLIG